MKEDIKKFEELFSTDQEFQSRLQKAISSYTGEKSEEAIFNNILVPIAAEYGLSASYDELKEYLDDIETTSKELTPDELEQAAGGGSNKIYGGGINLCYGAGIGLGGSDTTDCIVVGAGGGTTICLGVGREFT